ncbi:hypothetical protein Ciccas_006268 [Cichlidogyrus casuarinus]|uniref:L-aminoadipate-semialdehyde dehydrogenase-phosphopantetheinyl transferase n=1 Tax=Cichlidogyrus casuarinus TaxID=1844966 RepID=A0ABD2Q8N9_9PLAT
MIRWVFNHSNWIPNKPEWLRAMGSISVDEQKRISGLAYQRDAKAALAGRLMMRKVVAYQFSIASKEIIFERSKKGRPFLRYPEEDFDFNISHNGNLTVLTAAHRLKTGVDVMHTLSPPDGYTAEQYFQKLRSILTESEWDFIYQVNSESERIKRFYRHWCLKEAYAKAIGKGVGIDFSKLECRLSTPEHPQPWCSSLGQNPYNWQFEEHWLQNSHVCAIAWYGDTLPSFNCFATFTEMKFEDLIMETEIIHKASSDIWEIFKNKDKQPPTSRLPLPVDL